MSVQPYTSPYGPPLNNSGSSSGPSIPANAPVPDLAMVWQTAPDFVAAQASQSSGSASSSSGSPTMFPEFTLDFGSVQNTLNIMLSAASDVVQAYEALKSQFESVKDTVFGQTATITQLVEQGEYGDYTFTNEVYADPLQSQAQQFANGANGSTGMNDAQAFTLQSIATAMAMVGEFIALTQAIGETYADADFNSVLPPVTVTKKSS